MLSPSGILNLVAMRQPERGMPRDPIADIAAIIAAGR